MTRQYPVVYEWTGKNFSGYAPDVPGCAATAKALDSVRSALKGALEAHLHWLREEGDAIPSASDEVTLDMEPDAKFPQPRGYYVVVERLAISLPKAKSDRNKLTKVKTPLTRRRALQAA
jgi:predicted RNase H-like HicB family nuclease